MRTRALRKRLTLLVATLVVAGGVFAGGSVMAPAPATCQSPMPCTEGLCNAQTPCPIGCRCKYPQGATTGYCTPP